MYRARYTTILTRTKRACFRGGGRYRIVRHVLMNVSDELVGHASFACTPASYLKRPRVELPFSRTGTCTCPASSAGQAACEGFFIPAGAARGVRQVLGRGEHSGTRDALYVKIGSCCRLFIFALEINVNGELINNL